MIAGRVKKSCLWLSEVPPPKPEQKSEPKPEPVTEPVPPKKLYPDIASEAGVKIEAEAGAGSSTRGRSRSPILGLLPLLCLVLCCQGTYGFKAYDCQNENVSTTAFSLLAPDSCLGVASDLKFERQLSVSS